MQRALRVALTRKGIRKGIWKSFSEKRKFISKADKQTKSM